VARAADMPTDAVDTTMSLLVRLDRNGLLRYMTVTMEYAQLKPSTGLITMSDNTEYCLHLASKGVDGSRRKVWDSPQERPDYPTQTIVRTTV
jgi:hypothetical protein